MLYLANDFIKLKNILSILILYILNLSTYAHDTHIIPTHEQKHSVYHQSYIDITHCLVKTTDKQIYTVLKGIFTVDHLNSSRHMFLMGADHNLEF